MIFLDTSGLYALADSQDHNHQKARQYYQAIPDSETLSVSLLVLTECWHLIKSRAGWNAALKWWGGLRRAHYEILAVDWPEIEWALEIQKKYRDQKFGLVDCSTFALCEKYRVKKILTFDRVHFGIYRPRLIPELEIVPS